ncbi:MAG: ParB N-terminal domain-containing protein [Candidatus Peribacteria bacterium]|jgi:ParB-like chromosome segregation protein Spo0J|nr:ParB N-terminal domain-containing protein [Candidatus Peribacteria bacterium]
MESEYNTYECNAFLPKNIPLEEISLNVKEFQNRQKPYSEESVQKIIDSVMKEEFFPEIFDPIVVRPDPTTKKLYILSGHSRYEAFKRLGTTYADHPKVRIYISKYSGLFYYIPSRIIQSTSYEQAKTIAQISNVLATPETDIERAKLYRNKRQLGESRTKIEEFGKKYEGKNRQKIKAYSYLNPNGMLLTLLECFEGNSDEKKIIERIVKRIGEGRLRYPQLQDAHEQELYERLIKHEGYGTKAGQINSQQKFLEILKSKIEKRDPEDTDSPLNIRNIKSLSFSMTAYYKMLKKLQKTEQELKNCLQSGIKEYQKAVFKEDILSYKIKLSKILKIPLENLSRYENIETTLFSVKDLISPEYAERVRKTTAKEIVSMQNKIKKHKGKKGKFLEAEKCDLEIDFSSLQTEGSE